MTFRRAILYIAGVLSGFALTASQVSAQPACGLEIEINALRGGSPTVTVGGTKDITAKARIAKGTALRGTTIDTELVIEAYDGSDLVNSKSASPITLEVGKGGNGAKLAMNITQCVSGVIDFVATFSGYDDNGALCESTRSIRRTCK